MAETSEDRRRDYKRQVDQLQAQLGGAQTALREVTTELHTAEEQRDEAKREAEALKQQLVAAEQQIERARILGALGLASSLLVPLEELEADLRA